jgi:hypothetical protein
VKIEIKHRYSGSVLFSADAATLAACLALALAAGADLGGANLRGANLRGANLGDADLRGADLRGANLGDADLGDADLRGANLRGANLGGANLGGANLGGANLRGANLGGANLGGANLGGAAASLGITVDPLLPQRILDQIEAHPESWNQETWHSTCGTKHCIAGHATNLSGPLGKYLDKSLGVATAATLLLWRPDCEMPSFSGNASEAETLGRLRLMAEKASAPTPAVEPAP